MSRVVWPFMLDVPPGRLYIGQVDPRSIAKGEVPPLVAAFRWNVVLGPGRVATPDTQSGNRAADVAGRPAIHARRPTGASLHQMRGTTIS